MLEGALPDCETHSEECCADLLVHFRAFFAFVGAVSVFGIVGTHPTCSGPMSWGYSLNCSDVKNGLKETPEGTSLESRSLCCGVMSAPELWVCKGVSEHSILWGTELSLACFMTGQRNAKMENSALLSCFLLSYLFGFSLCILVLSYSCSSSYPWCERRAEQNGVFLPHLPCLTL